MLHGALLISYLDLTFSIKCCSILNNVFLTGVGSAEVHLYKGLCGAVWKVASGQSDHCCWDFCGDCIITGKDNANENCLKHDFNDVVKATDLLEWGLSVKMVPHEWMLCFHLLVKL